MKGQQPRTSVTTLVEGDDAGTHRGTSLLREYENQESLTISLSFNILAHSS
jgi:hypothetical protein